MRRKDGESSVIASGLFPCAGHGLKALITRADPGIRVVSDYTLRQLPPVVEEFEAALLMVDVEGQLSDLVSLLEELALVKPAIKLGFVSRDLPPEAISRLLRFNPKGFLSKVLDGYEMAASIRLMMAGHLVFGNEVIAHLWDQRPALKTQPQLEPREKELLQHVMRGLDNASIAAEMFMSRAAVKRAVQVVLAKLGVKNRTQAAVWAAQCGIV